MQEELGLVQLAMAELSAALRNAVGASSLIDHRLLKGEFRERRVIAGLRQFIPRRYEMYSGVVVNADGNYSAQQDIIISDSVVSPPFLAAGELGVLFIETVSAVIEVKSVATAQAVHEAVTNIASVKRLASDEPRVYTEISGGHIGMGENVDKPFGGILFLSSGISDEAILDAYTKATASIAPNDRPNALVVVDGSAFTWGKYADSGQLIVQPEPLFGSHVVLQRLGVNALLVFYIVLMRILKSYQPPDLDLLSYISKSGGYGRYEILVQEMLSEHTDQAPGSV
jgi:hypothetical protein